MVETEFPIYSRYFGAGLFFGSIRVVVHVSSQSRQLESEHPDVTLARTTANSNSSLQDLPTMTILLDKWFDGDPSNNDYFKTKFEHDPKETQLRFGGDIKGLTNNRTLDYLHGMGIRAIYIAGTPWLNMPWQADSKLEYYP